MSGSAPIGSRGPTAASSNVQGVATKPTPEVREEKPVASAPELRGSTAPEKVPPAVDVSARGAAERKVRAALARMSSELSGADSKDSAKRAIQRAQQALTGIDSGPVFAVLDAFATGAQLLGHDDCAGFAGAVRDGGKAFKDWHLTNAYGELSGAARSLDEVNKREKAKRAEDGARAAVQDVTDFAVGMVDGANPLPSPDHGSVFHHETAYRNGRIVGVLLGFAGDMAAMIGGGGMIAGGGVLAYASGGVLTPVGASTAGAGMALVGAGAAGLSEHAKKLGQLGPPLREELGGAAVHEARTLEQYRASGKKPPKDVTLPSGEPNPSAEAGGKRHEVDPAWDADKQASIAAEQHVIDSAAKQGYRVEWLKEVSASKKQAGESLRNPDVLLEGRVFDIFTPRAADPQSVLDHIMGKVDRGQAERIILNMEMDSVNTTELIELIERSELVGVKEIIIFRHDNFIFPRLKRKGST